MGRWTLSQHFRDIHDPGNSRLRKTAKIPFGRRSCQCPRKIGQLKLRQTTRLQPCRTDCDTAGIAAGITLTLAIGGEPGKVERGLEGNAVALLPLFTRLGTPTRTTATNHDRRSAHPGRPYHAGRRIPWPRRSTSGNTTWARPGSGRSQRELQQQVLQGRAWTAAEHQTHTLYMPAIYDHGHQG